MIHPNTELKLVSPTIGYGVFATTDIKIGTIVYVKDSLEHTISPTDFLMHNVEMQAVIEKYSYIDQNGNRIVSWDFAKYVNHCCNCNTISTGYGFEIAIRDIQKGEQITDEYGIFNLESEMPIACGAANCRKTLFPSDFDRYYAQWDEKIKAAIPFLFEVDQPLMSFVEPSVRAELDELFTRPETYKSVYYLKHKSKKVVQI